MLNLQTKVDIIIPVYRGLAETQRCINSVLAYAQQTVYEIVVINDHSPQPELTDWLRELAAAQIITLLENSINTGFVNAVNRGMVQHIERDVVLLNSDTEVHGDWLDRLCFHAASDAMVATVTPFSNNATLCSYPRINHNNALPVDWDLAALDTAFATLNSGIALPIPTAVGFCMYIRRACLQAVGYFNAHLFQQGYGEENEFCLRAAELGFKHILAADIFVYHQGACSFGAAAKLLSATGEQKLLALYPNYLQQINDYCTHDPARVLRRRIDALRLAHSARNRLLFITHNWGGGTEKHVQELAKILEPEFEVFILRPSGVDTVSIEWARSSEEYIAYFMLPDAYQDLLTFIGKLQIVRLHFHHIIGMNWQILQLPQHLGLPYDFTIHDYYPICPQYTLTTSQGLYCGEPDINGCNACLAERPAIWGLDIITWREMFIKILHDAERVIVASQDAEMRMRRYIPHANYLRLVHPERINPLYLPRTNPNGELKILVLGRLTAAKGLHKLAACAEDAQQRHLPVFFRVLGEAESALQQERLSFYGCYQDAELPQLIGRERPDIIFFPAQWPETYSYTLSYALATGLPIVAPRLGAFIERLANYPNGYLFAWDLAAALCNDLLLSIADKIRAA